MIRSVGHHDQKPGWMFLFSLTLHLAIIFICSRTDLFQARLQETTSYYVDIVSLPTADPAAGIPGSADAGQNQPPQPLPAQTAAPAAPASSKPAMSIPVKSSPAVTQKSLPSAESSSTLTDQEARAFSERMSRLEHSVEGRHQAAALESLQRKAATRGKPGAPGGSGATAGYDYAAYIQSRLKDALASTMVYRSKQPEAFVQIYIDKRGKLLRYVMIKPSGDKLFNDSVIRTIEKAKADFPPTPTGTDFDKLYVFSPQEVSKK